MSKPYKQDFNSLGEFLRSVVFAGSEGGDRDPRLVHRAAAGLNEQVPSEGGFVAPDDFALDLWEAAYSTGSILSAVTRQPVSGQSLRLPATDETSRADGSRSGGLRSYWVAEAGSVTATKPKFRTMQLEPKRALTIGYITDEMAQDTPAFSAWFRRAFAREASFIIEDAMINGDGVGKPLGILSSAALIQVTPQSGQGATAIRAENITGMAARLWGPSHRTAKWYCGNDVYEQLAGLTIAGQPALQQGPNGDRTMLQMPVYLTEYNPALSNVGDILLCDPAEYILAEKAPDIMDSIHVRFIEHERVLRVRFRTDGQPGWSGAIAPKNGGATQSPFIALADTR